MRHLIQVVRNGLGDRAGTCVDPKIQTIHGKAICLVSCQRSPEPVFLSWKGTEKDPEGDFFVRSSPRTDRLSARECGDVHRDEVGVGLALPTLRRNGKARSDCAGRRSRFVSAAPWAADNLGSQQVC